MTTKHFRESCFKDPAPSPFTTDIPGMLLSPCVITLRSSSKIRADQTRFNIQQAGAESWASPTGQELLQGECRAGSHSKPRAEKVWGDPIATAQGPKIL